LSERSVVWSRGDYEQIARRFAPMHDRLVAALEPAPGERWLDVATGTGEVALRAARAGARVCGLDMTRAMLARARAKADATGLEVELVLGDAEALPFEDSSFDVVCSSMGVIFAPDRGAVARELARVTRPGGRLGLTVWRARPEQQAIYDRFRGGPAPVDHHVWGDEEVVTELLCGEFELDLQEGVWQLEGESPDDLYEFMAAAAPPTIDFLERLSPEERDGYRAAAVEYWRGYAGEDGRVREPWRYLVVLGRRR
jgi:SAM-dependent methyltransferase